MYVKLQNAADFKLKGGGLTHNFETGPTKD
jgi:hypothetical protein